MTMGLRTVERLPPMTTTLFRPGKMAAPAAISSSVIGVLVMLLGRGLPLPFDTLFLGLLASIIILLADFLLGKKR